MKNLPTVLLACAVFVPGGGSQQLPHAIEGGYELPNGWRLTPLGRAIQTEDMVLNVSVAPDRKSVVALHSGFNPHGLVVVDARSEEAAQRIPLKSAWLGLAWHPNGKRLYVSGGNANGRKPTRAPIYIFDYENGRLSNQPSGTLEEAIDTSELYWSGLVHHHTKPLLFAANRGTGAGPSNVVVFDTASGKLIERIPVEVNPYALALSDNGQTLYVSNWGSDSVSVIDVNTLRVTGRIAVGDNPNDMALSRDGRLFVSCANDNIVAVIDTKTRQVIERVSTALTPNSPEGSTPNALALDRENQMLFIANADNNDVAVVRVAERAKSEVLGFLPVGWYPSALAIQAGKLYVGNSKGMGSYADIRGPGSPLPPGPEGNGSVKSLQKGSVEIVDLTQLKTNLRAWTKQVYNNTPYHDDQLVAAKAPAAPTVIPREVGVGSPIKHVLYIIKENRTYDQVLGDLGKGNGDPRLTIFGEKVTPNHHALARPPLGSGTEEGAHVPQLWRVRHARQHRHHHGSVARRGRTVGPRRAQVQAARNARYRQHRRIPARIRRVRAQLRQPGSRQTAAEFHGDEPA
ncbi:MAG TPA: beta-propeller fold lactonase family protein [Candidatus Acidoferrales bacterium]|jgi:YVTN family beta-propeller protein|nr:beta-propeller fold lactonase family protein [Candidatus Acidoferrales bacterium]